MDILQYMCISFKYWVPVCFLCFCLVVFNVRYSLDCNLNHLTCEHFFLLFLMFLCCFFITIRPLLKFFMFLSIYLLFLFIYYYYCLFIYLFIYLSIYFYLSPNRDLMSNLMQQNIFIHLSLLKLSE